ncbi:MAG TPA: glucose-6-phosphate dehydrogenase assembly protein OpcA [Acidimicrobiales bacterium]|nr:glucose-6-phosphate dehydrogenase assembly protein OpcA [Acidimicrobiales bacterium]
MTTTLWDTNGGDIMKALSAERRAGGAVASGLAVTFVTVVDEKNIGDAERAATIAAQAHPCRLLMVIRRQIDTTDRLDAEVQVGGRLGPIEAVVMRMYGRLTLHSESVVLPLLAPDAPVVTWWHSTPPDRIATDALGVLAERRVTDCALGPDPMAALQGRAEDFAPGDTDLAWTRATPWRSLLASAFDASAASARSARVAAEAGNPTAALLAGWLAARLGVPVEAETSPGPGITEVEVALTEQDEEQTLRISRPDGRLATFSRTGQPDRELPLLRRDLGDLLAEELRRLEVDEVYGEALSQATGIGGLNERSPRRTHIWRDPALAERAG